MGSPFPSSLLARALAARKPRSRRVRLLLEELETRLAPALFVVNTGNPADLIAAINAANANGQTNTIQLSGSYDLTAADNSVDGPTGLPVITSPLTIVGDASRGALISRSAAQGTPDFRLFDVAAAQGPMPAGQLNLEDVTLVNGLALGTAGGAGKGGAVFSQGQLSILAATLQGNTAQGGGDATTITGGAGEGGAVCNESGSLSILDSTLAQNTAAGGTGTTLGGDALGAAVFNHNGFAQLTNDTIAGNVLSAGPGQGFGNAAGGAVYNLASGDGPGGTPVVAQLTLTNNILAASADDIGNPLTDLVNDQEDGSNVNTAAVSATLNGSNPTNIVQTDGGNIVNGTATTSTANILVGDPLLDPAGLADNGGPTQTIALQVGSPALGSGTTSGLPPIDQRGFPRTVAGAADSGALENQPAGVPVRLGLSGSLSLAGSRVLDTFTVTALDDNGATVTNYSGRVHFSSTDPLAALPAAFTFSPADAGVHTFHAFLQTTGTQDITATDTVQPAVTGTHAGLLVQFGIHDFLVSGFPDPMAAGTPGTFTVTAEDAYGNRITNYRGTITFTSFDGGATLPADYTFTAADQGRHTFQATLITAGPEDITVTDTADATLTGSDNVNVNNGPASQLFADGLPPTAMTDDVQVLEVAALDQFGNVVPDYAGTITFHLGDPQADILPVFSDTPVVGRQYSYGSIDQGDELFLVTFHTPGVHHISITDDSNPALRIDLPDITVASGDIAPPEVSEAGRVTKDKDTTVGTSELSGTVNGGDAGKDTVAVAATYGPKNPTAVAPNLPGQQIKPEVFTDFKIEHPGDKTIVTLTFHIHDLNVPHVLLYFDHDTHTWRKVEGVDTSEPGVLKVRIGAHTELSIFKLTGTVFTVAVSTSSTSSTTTVSQPTASTGSGTSTSTSTTSFSSGNQLGLTLVPSQQSQTTVSQSTLNGQAGAPGSTAKSSTNPASNSLGLTSSGASGDLAWDEEQDSDYRQFMQSLNDPAFWQQVGEQMGKKGPAAPAKTKPSKRTSALPVEAVDTYFAGEPVRTAVVEDGQVIAEPDAEQEPSGFALGLAFALVGCMETGRPGARDPGSGKTQSRKRLNGRRA